MTAVLCRLNRSARDEKVTGIIVNTKQQISAEQGIVLLRFKVIFKDYLLIKS